MIFESYETNYLSKLIDNLMHRLIFQKLSLLLIIHVLVGAGSV